MGNVLVGDLKRMVSGQVRGTGPRKNKTSPKRPKKRGQLQREVSLHATIEGEIPSTF